MRTFSVRWSSTAVVALVALLWLPAFAWSAEFEVNLRRDTLYGGKSPGAWAVSILFNRAVFPSNLKSALSVSDVDGGEPVAFELQDMRTGKAAKKSARQFRLVPLRATDEPRTVKITVKKGLPDSSGRHLLAEAKSFKFTSYDLIKVSGYSTYQRSGQDKGLYLRLDSNVAPGDLSNAIEITPRVENVTVLGAGYHRYRIAGDFVYNEPYVLHVRPVRTRNGESLFEEKEIPFKGPGLPSKITFRSANPVIELKGRQLLPISLSNVSKVRCNLKRIPPYLLPEVTRAGEGSLRVDDEKWNERLKALKELVDHGTVKALFAGESNEAADVFFAREEKDQVFHYSLPLSFRSGPEQGGAWWVELTDPDTLVDAEAAEAVQITDLSISYKLSARSVLLWVTSIYSGEPVSGVSILLGDANGTKFFAGDTDQRGLLHVKNGEEFPAVTGENRPLANEPLNLAQVRTVVGATEKDSCAVKLNSDRLKPFSVKQTEKVVDVPQDARGYLFTERGIYQPGETAHFKFVMRSYRDGRISPPVGERIRIQIVDPRNDVHYNKVMTLGEFGTCHDSFIIKPFFRVGTYTLRARAVKDKAEESEQQKKDAKWFTRTFQVQEYKRPRHFVSISAKREQRPAEGFVGIKQEEDYLLVEVTGQYYSGGPLKHARTRWKATLVPIAHKIKGLDGFTFGNEDTKDQFLESGEAMLDKAGSLKLTIPLDTRLMTGLYGVKISATVLDVDGEPATEVMTYRPKPQYLVGISLHPERVQSNYASPITAVVVDKDGNRVETGELTVSVLRQDYFYVQKRDQQGNINHLWEEGWVKSMSGKASILKGQAQYDLELNAQGDFMVSFTFEDEKGARYSSQTVFKVGWEEYDNWVRNQHPHTIPNSNEILLGLSKKEYRVGDSVAVEFQTRRPVSKCLITVEKGDILGYQVIDVNGRHGKFRIKASEKFEPNVYVSVMGAAGRSGFPVYRSQTDNDIPMVFYGYANVRIRRDLKALQLQIEPDAAELKGRPGEEKSLSFTVTDDNGKGVQAEMAVCVVDEAVLALTGFATPDLSTLTDFKLPLSVFTGDLRLSLISQDLLRMLGTRPLTGGGMGFGDVESSLRKDFRPVAYFNPALLSDASGNVQVKFKLPDTTTAYRVYAVVCDRGSGFVSGQRKMVVNKEFYVEPSLPRFVIPGDSAVVPLMVYNKTDADGTVSVKASSSQELNISLKSVPEKLESYSSERAVAKIQARGGGADEATLRFQGAFSGAAGNFQDAIELKLPLNSRYLPVNLSMIGGFRNYGEIGVKLPAALKSLDTSDLTSRDFKAHLVLSTTNWAQIEPGLKYLLRYPYGCVEQTSSGIIPLAGLRNLIRSGAIPGMSMEEVDKFLKAGVNRLLSMQTANGGFAYWPGRLDTSWWGTLYATFALSLSQQAGYDVPKDRFAEALKYLKKTLFSKREPDRWHRTGWTVELALYNLALNGMLSHEDLESFIESYDSMSNQSKALALLAGKKIDYFSRKELAEKVSHLDTKFDPGMRSYHDSSYRTIAICLLAALEAGQEKKAALWAGYLVERLKQQGRFYSTADTGWCLLALGKFFEGKDSGKAKPTTVKITIGDKAPIELPISEATASVELDPFQLANHGKIRLSSPSRNLINYALRVTYPDVETDPSELNHGFGLTKKIVNLNGKEEIRVGDVVRVEIDMNISRLTDDYYGVGFREYLALEDPVPAGLVPINSDLKTEGPMGEKTQGEAAAWRYGFYDFNPTYSQFRDDGVRVFRDRAYEGSYRYTYLARAVMEGDFWMRGSRLSLMYDPDVFGKTLGKRVVILPMAK